MGKKINLGKRGRLPKKDYEKVMSGNLPVKKEHGKPEDILETDPPVCPNDLTDAEIVIWYETLELLGSQMRRCDVAILAAYCNSYIRWKDAEEQIEVMRKEKPLYALIGYGANDQMVVNPLVNISRRALSDAIAYAIQMGMTPAARMRVDVETAEKETNLFAKLKKKKNNAKLDNKSNKLRKGSKPAKKQK